MSYNETSLFIPNSVSANLWSSGSRLPGEHTGDWSPRRASGRGQKPSPFTAYFTQTAPAYSETSYFRITLKYARIHLQHGNLYFTFFLSAVNLVFFFLHTHEQPWQACQAIMIRTSKNPKTTLLIYRTTEVFWTQEPIIFRNGGGW